MVGFSQSKISKIENGNWDSLSDLRLIARALGVKLKKLIDDEPDSGGSNIKEDAAVDEHERWRGRLFF
jgi:transcriptional regulator with XRE-family HTH domain